MLLHQNIFAGMQKQFAEHVVRFIKDDPNVIALAAAGSWITNELDQYSDLDLILVTEEKIGGNKERMLEYARRFGKLLNGFTGEHVGEPRVLICLYDDPLLHVDIKFLTLDEVNPRIETPVILFDRTGELAKAYAATESAPAAPDLQWIEDRFWIWVHYALLKIGRGELMEARGFFGFLRNMVFGPLLQKQNNKLSRGVRKVEAELPSADLEKLKGLLPDYSQGSLLLTLRNAVSLYRELRMKLYDASVKLHSDAEARVMEYFVQVLRPASEVRAAYNRWSEQYDTNFNPTRDLEAVALRETLNGMTFLNCLEIGCGTGKNSEYLVTKADDVLAVDLSEEMMKRAERKLGGKNIRFVQADVSVDWDFIESKTFDLATFSLVLEHIDNMHPVFEKLKSAVKPGGYVYIGELHPFKQYAGSRARFETEEGLQTVHGFQHHITDFTGAAAANDFELVSIKEYFDDEERTGIPRVLAMLFRRN